MYLKYAREVLRVEAEALKFISAKLDNSFNSIVGHVVEAKGRVVVCGIGKSGHIGKKIAATLMSTGTPSSFLHPAEALHGDLGLVLPNVDIFLCISNSGETEELVKLIPFIRDNRNLLLSMTGNPNSSLARVSDYHLDVGVEQEACPMQLAPTASTTAALAMGDALAVALMKARDFRPEHFARFHPGGQLGRRLLGRVGDFMVPAVAVSVDADFKTVLSKMAESSGGIICVMRENKLVGAVTDGDIRRKLNEYCLERIVASTANDFMTMDPKVVSVDTRCSDADSLMSSLGINSLLVVNELGDYFVYQTLNRG